MKTNFEWDKIQNLVEQYLELTKYGDGKKVNCIKGIDTRSPQQVTITNEIIELLYPDFYDYVVHKLESPGGIQVNNKKIRISRREKSLFLNDLIQEGVLVTTQSIRTYNPSKSKISTFLYLRVGSSIHKYLQENKTYIRLPKHVYQKVGQNLFKQSARKFVSQVSKNLRGLDPKKAIYLYSIISNIHLIVDENFTEGDLKEQDRSMYQKDLEEILLTNLRRLSRNGNIVYDRFGLVDDNSHTLEELAEIYNLSIQGISLIINKVLQRLSQVPELKELTLLKSI